MSASVKKFTFNIFVPKTCFSFLIFLNKFLAPRPGTTPKQIRVKREGGDFGRTTHQNYDLAADITNKLKLKPISTIESTIWPHTSKLFGYLKRTTLRGAQKSNHYIIHCSLFPIEKIFLKYRKTIS